jgi:hypothetical protein
LLSCKKSPENTNQYYLLPFSQQPKEVIEIKKGVIKKMADNVEERLAKLETTISSQQHEIERLQAINEIQNLVAKYEVIHTPATERQSPQLFALKQPDVSVEIAMWGVFIGADQVRKMYREADEGKPIPGAMMEHQLTTPCIQVAKDGKTAKGLWFSPGHETFPGPDGKLQPKWCWGKFGADFIKEDGEWKIWHYHWYDTFMIPFDKSWVDTPQPALGTIEEHPGFEPNLPPTSRSTYFPDQVRAPIPDWPEPYDTWDGKSVC